MLTEDSATQEGRFGVYLCQACLLGQGPQNADLCVGVDDSATVVDLRSGVDVLRSHPGVNTGVAAGGKGHPDQHLGPLVDECFRRRLLCCQFAKFVFPNQCLKGFVQVRIVFCRWRFGGSGPRLNLRTGPWCRGHLGQNGRLPDIPLAGLGRRPVAVPSSGE